MVITDFHSHILPGVDDGARDIEESMAMLKQAYDKGTRRIFLTPHYIPGRNHYTGEILDQKFEELKGMASQEYPEMELYLGNELYYTGGFARRIKESDFHTMNGSRYVLVEFATNSHYEEIYQAVRELTEVRLFPVIAHVERYKCLHRKEKYLKELKNLGAYFQMNGEAITGRHSGWNKKILSLGYINFLGSDAHDTDERNAQLSKAADIVMSKSGTDRAEKILNLNADAVISNLYI